MLIIGKGSTRKSYDHKLTWVDIFSIGIYSWKLIEPGTCESSDHRACFGFYQFPIWFIFPIRNILLFEVRFVHLVSYGPYLQELNSNLSLLYIYFVHKYFIKLHLPPFYWTYCLWYIFSHRTHGLHLISAQNGHLRHIVRWTQWLGLILPQKIFHVSQTIFEKNLILFGFRFYLIELYSNFVNFVLVKISLIGKSDIFAILSWNIPNIYVLPFLIEKDPLLGLLSIYVNISLCVEEPSPNMIYFQNQAIKKAMKSFSYSFIACCYN